MEYSGKTLALRAELERLFKRYMEVHLRLVAHEEVMARKAEDQPFHVPSVADLVIAVRLGAADRELWEAYRTLRAQVLDSEKADQDATPDFDLMSDFFDGLELDNPDTEVYSYRVCGSEGWQRVK